MKLSSRTKYGIKAMYYLAKSNNTRPISLIEISKMTKSSTAYLEKILSKLRKSNLLKAHRGVKGGYTLIKDPTEITLVDLVIALEGNFLTIDCLSKNCKEECPNKDIFNYIYFQIETLFKGITLADLIKKDIQGDSYNE